MIAVTITTDDITVTIEAGQDEADHYAPDIADDITNRAIKAVNCAAAIQLAQYQQIAALGMQPHGQDDQ